MRLILFTVLFVFAVKGYADPYCDAAIAFDQNNYELVEELMLPLANKGQAYAQANLGVSYWSHAHKIYWVVNKDKLTREIVHQRLDLEKQGTKWIEKAALQGRHEFQALLGDAYFDGRGTPQRDGFTFNDLDKYDVDRWYEAKDKGDVDTANQKIYNLVSDSRENQDKFFEWYEKAASQGNLAAQFVLADLYNGGWMRNDLANPEKARHWWKVLSRTGSTYVQVVLADSYRRSDKAKQAIKWYQKAIRGKHLENQTIAIRELAELYREGDGIPRNDRKAARLFRRLADMGDADAHYELGVLLSESSALTKDSVKAYAHFSMANTLMTYEDAEEKLDSLAAKMTSKQISKGQSKANDMWSKLEAAGGPKLDVFPRQLVNDLPEDKYWYSPPWIVYIPKGITCP